ncbi:MAG: HEAT repeat domain-containing protein [Planctomycetes bacterium]|nr:HEAT repeat domain-containing protein [Planctomycetota bacterium]
MRIIFVVLGLYFCCAATLMGQPDPYVNRVAKASNEWKKTAKRMKLPPGVQADMWAAEPLVANIVAFHFDEKGRCFVAETFRLHKGVTDNRNHPRSWTDDDLACRTVADRIAMYKKHLKDKFSTYAIDMDRVRLVEDTTGSGRADRATVFADGFRNAEDGIGSGVLARNGKVWFTNIPDLWLLQDTKGTGRANVKKSLHTGYGVHTAFLGHDMHGLRFGPDGKLYFSIGDRGLHVKTADTVVAAPDTGSVLRCNPDGSELEIFASGLRNPQELAFDELGNLFTGDNNADGGDQARWVHVVEGGDSGWRMSYQYLPRLGVWNEERLWHTQATNTASYLLPPLAHIASGPSGLTYHPGTSLLPEKYAKHFFLCDFRGGSGGSGVRAFTLKPKGASFELINRQEFAWTILATDCDFGPDGGFYLSDWVEGWGTPNKGRIFKLFDPKRLKDPVVAEVKKLLAEGFSHRSAPELAGLLDHKDQRVRQEAQFALADKKDIDTLAGVAPKASKLARLHAIWGLGQIGRKDAKALEPLLYLVKDADADVRCQINKVVGEARWQRGIVGVTFGLSDPEPRVRFQAALAAGKIGVKEVIASVLKMLKANNDTDPYLRHAGVMALMGIGDRDALKNAAADSSSSVRLASLLAMRRLAMPEVALFLNDADKQLVLEAARAIYDVPIPAAMPALAERALQSAKDVPEPAFRRALAANYRLGAKENARALASAATRPDVPIALREQALKMLQAWEQPSGRDWVVGLWRPIKARPGSDVAEVLRPALPALMTGPAKVRTESAKLAAKHGMKEIGPALRKMVLDKNELAGTRIASMQALESLKDARVIDIARAALGDADPRLRHQGRRILLATASKAEAVQTLKKVLDNGAIVERQGALALLGNVKTPAADELLEHWLDQMNARKAPPEIHLDIILAAREVKTPSLNKKLAAYEATRNAKNPVSMYREAIIGGDADAGRAIFFEKSEVSCLRCHKVNGIGGDVGPDLSGIGKKQKRDYLLESLVDPNKQIAKGYESLLITLKSGLTRTGILKGEDAKTVRLMTPEGQMLAIPKADIDERARGPSAMPSDLVQKLTRREVRDLVEFLSSLR